MRTIVRSQGEGEQRWFYGGGVHTCKVLAEQTGGALSIFEDTLERGKVTPQKALLHAHKAPDEVKRIYKHVHDKAERYELNLYVVGEEEEPDAEAVPVHADAAGSQLPEERSPNQ